MPRSWAIVNHANSPGESAPSPRRPPPATRPRPTPLRHWPQHDRRAPVRQHRQARAQHDHNAAEPDPLHQRIQIGVNHRLDSCPGCAPRTQRTNRAAASSRPPPSFPSPGSPERIAAAGYSIISELPLRKTSSVARSRVVIVVLRLVEILAKDRVRPDGQRVSRSHFLLNVLIEGRPCDADENQDHAEVHHVAAVAPRVAHREFADGGEQVCTVARGDHARAADKTRQKSSASQTRERIRHISA